MFRLLLVTDRHATRDRPLVEVVAAALRGGVDAVQLREKDLDGGALYRLGCELRALCTAAGAKLLVNDRIDVALACGADGVHLPVRSFDPADARALLGAGKLIGCSTHSRDEAQRAAAGDADYVVLGPIFATPAKRPYGEPLGLDTFARVARSIALPVLGIGGIDAASAADVRASGAIGVAVIAAILAADDPEAAARAIRGAP